MKIGPWPSRVCLISASNSGRPPVRVARSASGMLRISCRVFIGLCDHPDSHCLSDRQTLDRKIGPR